MTTGPDSAARLRHVQEVFQEAIEIEPAVAAIARRYFQFPPQERGWRIVEGDVRERLKSYRHQDFLLVDIAQAGYTPAWVTETAFLATAKAALAKHGAGCINIIPRDRADFAQRLLRIRQAFARRRLPCQVPGRTLPTYPYARARRWPWPYPHGLPNRGGSMR